MLLCLAVCSTYIPATARGLLSPQAKGWLTYALGCGIGYWFAHGAHQVTQTQQEAEKYIQKVNDICEKLKQPALLLENQSQKTAKQHAKGQPTDKAEIEEINN